MRKIVKATTTFLLTTGVIFLSLFLLAQTTHAAIRCETQYGGSEVCVRTGELQIDKEVLRPKTDNEDASFVDNLGINDHKYTPGEIVEFRLKVKNVGDNVLNKIHINDTLPPLLERIEGNLEETVDTLGKGETIERHVKARVVSVDQFPKDSTVLCDVNLAKVSSPDNGGHEDSDTAQVCLEKKAGEFLGITTLPEAGSRHLLILFLGSLGIGIFGLIMLRVAMRGGEKYL